MELGDGLPLQDDDASYQCGAASGFENSRAETVVAFAQATALEQKKPGDRGGSILHAWATQANSTGQKPLDFSFLMGSTAPSTEVAASRTPPGFDSAEASPASEDRLRAKRAQSTENFLGGLASKQAKSSTVRPPRPVRKPRVLKFGAVEGEDRGPQAMRPPISRTDIFAWMRDDSLEDPEVQSLLKEEDSYARASQEHLEGLRGKLYDEMLGHIQEAETGMCTLYPGGYGYVDKKLVGKPYTVHCRRRMLENGDWGPEELVLDENEFLAAQKQDVSASSSQKPFLSVCGPHFGSIHSQYVYGVDLVGDQAYTLRFLPAPGAIGGSTPQVEIPSTDGAAVWSKSGDAFYYVHLDAEFRGYSVRRHRLGDTASGENDDRILDEDDQKFSVYISHSSCRRFLIVQCASSETQENHLLDLEQPDLGLHVVSRRQFGHLHEVDHSCGWIYALTNKNGAKNMKLCRVRASALPDAPLDSWEDVFVSPAGVTLENLTCFERFAALKGREAMEHRIYVQSYGDADSPVVTHAVAFPHTAAHTGTIHTPRGSTRAFASYNASLGCNPTFAATEFLRYTYSSATHVGIHYEYNVRTREHRVLKEESVPNYDASLYRAERITTPCRGVPVSLVFRKDLHPRGLEGGPFPVLLTGYGAYGASQDLNFDGNRLSLLDRGMVYALAHVRGGGDLGREWYEQGRYLHVKNRFADFVDAAETLISLHITTPEQLAAWGTSSGGLLVTASMNLRPDLFRAVLLEVPFVDALNTMADPSVPLTVGEWEEVGNPNEREYFYYQLEYSPYDNIRVDAYPAALLTCSMHDSMVGYWEPLKYASKLRMLKTDDRPVLLKVSFNAGHGGVSDRYESMRDYAFHWTFLLEQLGLTSAKLLGTEVEVEMC